MPQLDYDVVVIGAGAGGLGAGAWACADGKKVLVVEAKDRVGGRASSEKIDGFTVNVGAIAIELGSTFEETMSAVGMSVDVREPSPGTVFKIDGKIVNPAKGGWGFLLGGMTKSASKIAGKFADARKGDLPDGAISTQDWLNGFTKNETVHRLFRNFCAAIWAVNADELPARAFLTYFGVKGAFKRFGFCPRGTIGVWEDMAIGIQNFGGEVWVDSPVSEIVCDGDVVTGVKILKDGVEQLITTRALVSNIGPNATVKLAGEEAFGADYVAKTKATLKPATNIVYNFATQERLIDVPGLITFANTSRICNLGELTATCPELAPEGWYLYAAYGVPRPSISDFDEAAEVEAGFEDLRNEFPGFDDKAKMLSVRVMRDEWPAQRSCAGYDMPQETPLKNLWHVGDAVKDYGDGGTQACAVTGKNAAMRIKEYLAAI